MTLDSTDDAAPILTRLSDTEGLRIVPEEWRSRLAGSAGTARHVHFLVLPAYVRYNDATPLAVAEGVKKPKKDLLFFPLGYSQIASSLRTFTDHRIEVLDPYAEYVDMWSLDQWLDNVYEVRGLADPDYLLIGGMSTSWPVITQATAVLKAKFPNAKIVCGGTVAGLHAELLLTKVGVDIAVVGEAEFVIADLFHNLDDISNVRGIAYTDGSGKVVRTPPPPPHDLNDGPEPAWDLFDTAEYVDSSKRMVGFRGLPINTSMGCPYACRFCYVPGGRSMRYLSVENVVDRMQRLKESFDLEFVAFYDDILFVDKDWMWELGEALLKAKVGLMWNCNTRVNLFSEKDEPLLRLLHRAGLVRMSFGIETGSPEILKNMGKTGVSPEKARSTLRLVRNCGIRATASMLLGFPGESADTIRQTVQFCKENLLYPSFYLLQPFPGTDVYERYVRETYDEEAYLELISDYREGERFPINLTEMSDDELMRLRGEAEEAMKQFHFSHYVRYHGWDTPQRLWRDARNELRRFRSGSVFVTP